MLFFLLLFPQLPTLFSLPSSPLTALGGSLLFTYRLFGSAFLKTEKLRWGIPTATTPFATLGFVQPLAFIPRSLSLPKGGQRMRSSILGI